MVWDVMGMGSDESDSYYTLCVNVCHFPDKTQAHNSFSTANRFTLPSPLLPSDAMIQQWLCEWLAAWQF